MKRKLDVVAQTVVFTFDGDLPSITLSMSKVSPSNATYAMLHGFSARIGDTAALSRKDKDGSTRTITEADRRAEIERAVAHYESGSAEWELGKVAARDPRATKLAEAKGISYDEARAILAKIELDALEAALAS